MLPIIAEEKDHFLTIFDQNPRLADYFVFHNYFTQAKSYTSTKYGR